MKIETEILKNAGLETFWKVLADFDKHPKWNPFIHSISAEKGVGKRLTVSKKSPGGKGMTFKPVVMKFDQNREFRWKGKLLVTGLFDGEHFFILEPVTE